MPNLKKLLSRFSKEEREKLKSVIGIVISFDWHSLDIKKLKGYQDIFRVRSGRLRIIFTRNNGKVFLLSIDRRNEGTYKF